MTDTPRLSSELNVDWSFSLEDPLVPHHREFCSPLNGISHEHHLDFIQDIYCNNSMG